MNIVVTQGIMCVLALVFVVSAFSKLGAGRYAAFKKSISDLLLPAFAGLAPVVIGVELVTAVLLVIPATSTYGLLLGAASLLLFTAVLTSAALRGIEASCNCFGALSRDSPVGHREVLRNLVLLASFTVGLVLQGDRMSTTATQWLVVGITFAVAAGALVAVVALAVNLRRLGIPVGDKEAMMHGPHDNGDEELFPVGATIALPGAGDTDTIVGVLSTTCGICVVAAGSFHQTAERAGASFVALVDDSQPGSPELIDELDRLGATRLLLSDHPELTPVSSIRPGYAVLDRNGTVTSSGGGHTELAMSLAVHD